MFKPKLFDLYHHYSAHQFSKDLMAGIIVGIVALPLAIAFAIASGVSPEKGLYTAIVAGFIISALGGSRVQIGGPTGAFIVIVYGVVQQFGENGLVIATFMAGIMLMLMGLARLGTVIQYIPYPLIVGFTSGIAVLIFSSQIKDLVGLQMGAVPADFIDKWESYVVNRSSINWYAFPVAILAILIIVAWPRVTHKVPGSLVAILVTTALVSFFPLPVETIGSRFGSIPSTLPAPSIPLPDFATIKHLLQPAFTIALLGGIESLLSAVVADGMTAGRHRSNMELVAQGAANIGSSLFGGIPATGAMARTATNIKNGGRTPVAGITHAITLLLIMLFAGKWAALIPMPALAGVLVVVAWNMSEWKSFRGVLKGARSDVAVMLVTFLLTVLFDLTVAIEIGLVLAVFLFMRKMIQSTSVNLLSSKQEDTGTDEDNNLFSQYTIPREVEVFEISGPLFFGAAYKFRDAIRNIGNTSSVLVIRMGQVPIIDSTGIKILEDVFKVSIHSHTAIILSEVHSAQVRQALKDAQLLSAIDEANITATFDEALDRCRVILS